MHLGREAIQRTFFSDLGYKASSCAFTERCANSERPPSIEDVKSNNVVVLHSRPNVAF
jgi:hypothetical protein